PIYAKHALPWPADEVKVEVVDDPEPFNPEANGGRPTQISPRTVEMLRQDHRIAVHVIGADGGDPAEAIQDKARAAKLEEKLSEAQRHIASLQEQASAANDAAAAKVVGEMAKLRQENAELRSKIAGERRK
ncbi:MAG: hypothetical protein ACRETD_06585, partial [Steroidobacteraceae bacterium]